MTAQREYPDFVARFYDVIYEKVTSGEDVKYYLKKMRETEGPVLELGVGTGRIFLRAIEEGIDIYGVDNSVHMIQSLKKKLNKKHHHRVEVQDVKVLNLPMEFNLIIAPFRMFSHLIQVEDQLKALNSVYKHMRPGSMFIFDLYVPDLEMLYKGLNEVQDFEGEYENGKLLKRTVSASSDPIKQITYGTMKFEWEEEEGKIVRREWNFQMRYFFRYELEHLIARSDLTLVTIFGDFHEGSLGPESKDFVVICRK